MRQSKLRFYLDENMDPEIAAQLRRRGIDALSARGEGMLTTPDYAQLKYAVINGRVLCTKDSDFANPANWHVEHHGIAYFPNRNLRIGYAVNALVDLFHAETAESMKNSLRYV